VRPDDARLVDSLETEANIEIKRKQFAAAEALLGEVLKARIAARGPNDSLVGSAENNLGVLEYDRSEIEAAIEHWTRAARINTAAGTLNWRIYSNLGGAHVEIGQLRAAATDYATGRTVAEREAPGQLIFVGECDTGLGSVLTMLGQLDRARPLIEKGLAAAR